MEIKPGKGGVHQRMWYTYILIDPADNSVFYVGKGKGERMNVHVKEARKGKTGHNPRKYQRMRNHRLGGDNAI